MRGIAARLLGRVAGGLAVAGRVAARCVPAACAVLVVFSIASRALHFASPALPPEYDDGLGEIMGFHFAVALNQTASMVLLAQAGVVLAVALGAWWLGERARGRRRPSDGRLRLPAALLVWLWLGLAAGNPVLDFEPSLLALLALTAPVLLVAGRTSEGPTDALRAGILAAGFAAALAAWLAAGPDVDRWDLVYGGAWVAICIAMTALRRHVAQWRDWATIVLVAYAGLQVATLGYDRLPVFRPAAGAQTIGEGIFYHWCEAAERGRVYATTASCNVLPERCRDDFVAEIDLRNRTRLRPLRLFDDGFYGRMLHLLCLPDRVQVGMAVTRLGTTTRPANVMEFALDEPTRVTKDVLGEASTGGTGVVFVHDADRNAVLYASETHNRILRVQRDTGERRWVDIPSIRRWPPPHRSAWFITSLPAPTSTAPDAVFHERGTAFFAEWMRGNKVVELDLRTLREVGVYRTNNGGNQQVTVDEARHRLLVNGLWGIEAFDLHTGERTARVRTTFAPRLPLVDTVHDLVYVPLTFGNHLLVLDRAGLRPLGRLAVGRGGRLAHLTADGKTLFASGAGRAYAFDAEELARRFQGWIPTARR